MVRFSGIGLLDEDEERGKVRIFETLHLFDVFRKRLWSQDPGQFLEWLAEWMGQNCFERCAERRLRFSHRSLDGACLVFGTSEKAAERLICGAGEILSDPTAEAYLRISTRDGKILSRVKRGEEEETFSFEYPIQEALFPPGVNLLEQFDLFSRTRQTQEEGGHVMVLE